ncbi:hypothetical protein [Humisphaera borealis]|uniref:Tetratricopeptide repeat protein n=1 Tax=Humisphaera borealis TaxID=2807512 RepID=A0A7M2WPF5_9BACT|nr:hypothetical protein [Humisphaera borealis]QOV87289.1 hypothetical protein IPV69_13405 [Humisphaera borealis]
MSASQKPVVLTMGGGSLKLAVAAALTVASLTTGVLGQARTPAAPPAVGAPATPAGAQGLDALSEETVMNELAGRGINSLLTRLFDEKKVPQADRDAFKALQALRELGAAPAMGNARRIYLLRQSVDGLDKLVPKLNDLNVLNNYAATLIAKGIEPDVDTLDYWGDNSSTQARIRPAARVAVQMLKKVSETAFAQAKALENQIKSPNDPKIDLWEKLEAQANQAKYVGALSAYYEVVSIDASGNNKAAWDERKKIADEAIKFLTDFDTPDSGVGPMVKMRIAKLQMGKGDYDAALKNFQLIIDKKMIADKKTVDMAPAPSEFQQNDARYFSAVARVLAKKPADAEKAANDLEAWQKSTLIPSIDGGAREGAQKMVGAQMTMLRYRIASAKAEAAPAGPARDKLNQAADTILTKLGDDFPQFQTLITELLVTRLPENADLKAQGAPVLQALITRGDGERNKPEGTPYDKKVLLRGLEAARVMADKKPGPGGANPEAIETAKLLIPLFQQKEGQAVEAANGFLDYGTDKLYAGKPNAAAAVDQAAYIAFTQYQKAPQDPAVRKLYERALDVAANPPFNRKEAFYPYANWLRVMGSPDKAISFYRKIPKGDKLEFNARYYEMVCTKMLLDQTKDAALRSQRMRDLSTMINQIIPLAQAAITSAASPELAATFKFRMMYATSEGAELALQQKQPKQAIALLQGFEEKIKGVANEEALKNKAMFIRANALINDGQIDQAIAQVQQLAGRPETAEFAIGMVGEILTRLTASFDTAKGAGDKDQMAKDAANKAKLTGFLVPWAANHKDPKIKAKVPEFTLYDANTKREAGQLLPDGPEKNKVNDEALAVYKKLKELPAMKDNSSVDFGIATCEYEKKNYEGASSAFGTLIRDGKLGGANIIEANLAGGDSVVKDNPVFWEANLKWIRSNLEIAKKPEFPNATKIKEGAERVVKDMFINYKDRTGGDKWRDDWVSLRKEVLPGWEPGVVVAPATLPASQPADGTATPAPAAPTATPAAAQ